jgi:anthranilate/para-aminobenzoate synthase component II
MHGNGFFNFLSLILKIVNMAIKDKDFNVYGVQFHPESILTVHGKILLKNFLDI